MRFKRRMLLETGLKQIEITPLIDCIFLLLIFFMLTSNFIIVPGITIKLPKASSAEAVKTQSITVSVSSEDIMYIAQSPLTYAEFETLLKSSPYSSVFIRADKDASLGVVVRIWDICRERGIDKIGIATSSGD